MTGNLEPERHRRRKRPYPDSEHIEGNEAQEDWFETPFPEMLCRSQERIEELCERAEEAELVAERSYRWEEGVACLTWLFSRVRTQNGVAVRIEVLSTFLDEITRFANTGIEPEWLRRARRQMGHSS